MWPEITRSVRFYHLLRRLSGKETWNQSCRERLAMSVLVTNGVGGRGHASNIDFETGSYQKVKVIRRAKSFYPACQHGMIVNFVNGFDIA
jgi:hypothetical protein